MNPLYLTDYELIENIEYARPWFIGLYMETFLNNLHYLSNRQYKSEFLYDIHRYDPILMEESILDISTRVESLLKIINGNRVLDALEIVIRYDTDNIYDIYARQESIYLLSLIKNRKINLPTFI